MAGHVTDGLVDYENIKTDPSGLNQLLADIAGMDRSTLSPADEQAFLINAYNVLVIKNVVDHYPLESPLDVNGFFDRNKFEAAGATYTLNDLEKKELFARYPDARLHFVLVCAAIGCPVLIDSAYRGNTLDEQLDTQTRLALDNPRHVRIEDGGKKVFVSELFSWYEKDFTDTDSSIQKYINRYRTDPIPESARIDHITYDWRLNDLKKKR